MAYAVQTANEQATEAPYLFNHGARKQSEEIN